MGRPQNKRKKQSESDVSESISDSEGSGEEEVIPVKKGRAAAKKSGKKAASDGSASDEDNSPKKLDKVAAKKPAASKADDSDSDSGPDDKNPPPKKGGKSVSTKTVDNSGEVYWELERNKRVSVSDFKGKTLIQIREYYEKDGKQLPGKKGIALNLGMWERLKNLTPEIDEVLKEKK